MIVGVSVSPSPPLFMIPQKSGHRYFFFSRLIFHSIGKDGDGGLSLGPVAWWHWTRRDANPSIFKYRGETFGGPAVTVVG